MNTLSRNHCIDTIKGFACIFVVLIHYNWGNDISLVLKTIGRFAVPYFFFVSGFYLPDSSGVISRQTVQRKARHILTLAGKSAVFYSLFCILWNISMNTSWSWAEFIREEITWGSIIKFFLSNDPFVYAHFWYLLASIYCYLTVLLLGDIPGKRGYFLIFVVLLSLYSIFAEFHGFWGLRNSISLTAGGTLILSNIFCFRALPFFTFGIYAKKACRSWKNQLPLYGLIAAVFLGFLSAVLESRKYGTILMYLGTHLSVLALALISIQYPGKSLDIMEYIGSKLSMYVYIYHIAVGKCIDLLYGKLHLWGKPGVKALRPLLVLTGALLVAQLIAYKNQHRTTHK